MPQAFFDKKGRAQPVVSHCRMTSVGTGSVLGGYVLHGGSHVCLLDRTGAPLQVKEKKTGSNPLLHSAVSPEQSMRGERGTLLVESN